MIENWWPSPSTFSQTLSILIIPYLACEEVAAPLNMIEHRKHVALSFWISRTQWRLLWILPLSRLVSQRLASLVCRDGSGGLRTCNRCEPWWSLMCFLLFFILCDWLWWSMHVRHLRVLLVVPVHAPPAWKSQRGIPGGSCGVARLWTEGRDGQGTQEHRESQRWRIWIFFDILGLLWDALECFGIAGWFPLVANDISMYFSYFHHIWWDCIVFAYLLPSHSSTFLDCNR